MIGTPDPRFQEYEQLLHSWAPRLDLISPGDMTRLRERHIEDSLRLLPLLTDLPPGPCLDVGSGAGLPGIPLAIGDPQRHWVLLEPRRKRAAFLEEVVRELELDCEVRAQPAEQAVRELGGSMTLVTARALAPPPQAIQLCLPFVAEGGLAAIFLGRGAALPLGAEEWSDGVAIVRVPATSP